MTTQLDDRVTGVSLPSPPSNGPVRRAFDGCGSKIGAITALPGVRSPAMLELRRRQDRLRRQLERLDSLRSHRCEVSACWRQPLEWILPGLSLLILLVGVGSGRLPWLIIGLLCLPLAVTVPLARLARTSRDPGRHPVGIVEQEIRRVTRQVDELDRRMETVARKPVAGRGVHRGH